MKKNKITSASFLITEDCNLRCIYCFENNKERCKNIMSKEVAEEAINFLIYNAAESEEKSIGITLFGGEPMLNYDIMKFILEYGKEQCDLNNIKFNLNIITNGTILTEKHIELYKQWYNMLGHLNIQLSIDGIPEVQNHNRPFVNGGKTSDIVEKNIKRYVELYKELNFPLQNLCVHSVLSKYSLPYTYESYLYFRQLGIECVWFLPCHDEQWNDDDINLFEKEYQKIADYIYEECKEKKSSQPLNSFSSLANCVEKLPNKTCGAGCSYATVAANGDLYACHHFYFHKDREKFKFGNVLTKEDDLEKRKFFIEYNSEDMQGKTKCKDCNISYCYRCLAANYVNNGDCMICFPKFCEMMIIEDRIRLNLYKKLILKGLFNANIYNGDLNKKINILTEQFQNLADIVLNNQKQLIELNNQIQTLSESIVMNNQLLIKLAQEITKNT